MSAPVCYSTDGTLMMVWLQGLSAVAKVFSIIQKLGPPLGLFINAKKCELFGLGELSSFSPLMKKSSVPNFEILGGLIFCAKFVAHKKNVQMLPSCLYSWRM